MKYSHAVCKVSRAAVWLQAWEILTALMKGRLRIEPRTGILLIKPTTTGKKPLDMIREGRDNDANAISQTVNLKINSL